MITKELDGLIKALRSRIEATLQHSPDPIAAEFYGRVLDALQEYREIRRRQEDQSVAHFVSRGVSSARP